MAEKSHKNILDYDISYKSLIGAKPCVLSSIKFINLLEFMMELDMLELVLFGGEKYDFIYSRIKYLIGVKSGITYFFPHNYVKIKVDS